jgi:hypothetical protein
LGIRPAPLTLGMCAWPCSLNEPMTGPGRPRNVPIHAWPKPILKTHRTHTMRTRQNPLNAMIMVLTAHLRCTRPPYRTARPGRLIRPTRVAAVSCQEVSPAFSQLG